ncbi:MAG: hypothetical protein IKE01_01360 [Clostridia bacterium]|nr:hypothetical protein [Clostridia bacterium]
MSDKLNKFREEYFSNEVLDIYDFFTKEQLKVIEKLGLKIENKKYSIYDFDVLAMDFFKFYKEKEKLKDKGIEVQDYMDILAIFEKINDINNL